MKIDKYFSAALVILGIDVVVSLALFYRPRPNVFTPKPRPILYFQVFNELGLDPQQKAVFTRESQVLQNRNIVFHNGSKAASEKIRAELLKTAPDPKVLDSYINEFNQNSTHQQMAVADAMLGFFEQLTPKQKRHFNEIMKFEVERSQKGKKNFWSRIKFWK